MKLSTLLKDVDYVVKQGNDELEIEHLVYNSKKFYLILCLFQ